VFRAAYPSAFFFSKWCLATLLRLTCTCDPQVASAFQVAEITGVCNCAYSLYVLYRCKIHMDTTLLFSHKLIQNELEKLLITGTRGASLIHS
jgi:hypothetical protein